MFHLLFTILLLPITLPFMLLRMLFGVLGISTHILLIPLKIFARHTVLCLVILAGVILYLAVKREPASLDALKPLPAGTQQAKMHAGNVPPVIDPVRKRENGDSAFATDLYVLMTDPERQEYSRAYYSAMATTAAGETHRWSFFNIHGAIKPGARFQNNYGETCRAFTEVLKVHTIEQTLSGTACSKGDGSWCKLKPNATPACGLGRKHGAFDGITRALENLF